MLALLLAGCRTEAPSAARQSAPPRQPELAPSAAPSPSGSAPAPVDDVERALAQGHPAVRERARSLLELCSVIQVPPLEVGEVPRLACLPASFGTPRSKHTFEVAADLGAGYLDEDVDVRGGLSEPGADERLIVLDGESNGSSGGSSGFLFRREGKEWALRRTFVSFPAISCSAIPRPTKTALLFCGFASSWQGQVNLWAATFDASAKLVADGLNAPEPSEAFGFLPPVQRVLRTSPRAAAVLQCPTMPMLSLQLLPARPIRIEGTTLRVLVHDVRPAQALKMVCTLPETELPSWKVDELTYPLELRGNRLVPIGRHAAQDARLRRLALIPPS